MKNSKKDAMSANELAQKVKSDAESGSNQMCEMLSSMEDIKNSSRNIANVIQVIDDIAFQTNILALNAAVEAARAGEQGQGFSVVADKIRQMAENSVDSVNDIRKIVRTIQKETALLLEMINNASDQGQQQAAATEEIESAMQQLATAANEIESVAGII